MGLVGALWGVAGISMVLAWAVIRLTPHAVEALSLHLTWFHWLALIVNVIFMAYSEGYKGFQRGFSPRVAARARHLRSHPVALHILLGPFFCFGFFGHTTNNI